MEKVKKERWQIVGFIGFCATIMYFIVYMIVSPNPFGLMGHEPKMDVYYVCSDSDEQCKWEGAKHECGSDNFTVRGYDLRDDLTTRTYHARCEAGAAHPKSIEEPSEIHIHCEHVGDYGCLEQHARPLCPTAYILRRWQFGVRNDDATQSIDYFINCQGKQIP